MQAGQREAAQAPAPAHRTLTQLVEVDEQEPLDRPHAVPHHRHLRAKSDAPVSRNWCRPCMQGIEFRSPGCLAHHGKEDHSMGAAEQQAHTPPVTDRGQRLVAAIANATRSSSFPRRCCCLCVCYYQSRCLLWGSVLRQQHQGLRIPSAVEACHPSAARLEPPPSTPAAAI